jgi:hypothetical protein
MGQKIDRHVFMTIAEVCSDLYPWTYSTIDANLKHFQVLVKNNDYSPKPFRTSIGVIMAVLSKVYGFTDEISSDYILRFFLSGDECLKFGRAAVLMKRYSTQIYGNDRYVKFDRDGKISLNI